MFCEPQQSVFTRGVCDPYITRDVRSARNLQISLYQPHDNIKTTYRPLSPTIIRRNGIR
jgi:hypothetical protein